MQDSTPRFPRRLAMAIAVVTASTVLLGARPAASAEQPGGADGTPAPILGLGHSDAVPGSFVVGLREGPGTASASATESTVTALHQRYKLNVRFVYTAALKGLAVRDATDEQLRQLAADPAVAYVAQDLKVSVASPARSGIEDELKCPPYCACSTAPARGRGPA